VQLSLGGLMRHNLHASLGQRGHLFVAFVVVVAVSLLVKAVLASPAATKGMVTAAALLASLVALQLLLGVEAWMMKFGAGKLPDMRPVTVNQAVICTAHFLAGSGIFATSVVLTLQIYRRAALAAVAVPSQIRHLEGAA